MYQNMEVKASDLAMSGNKRKWRGERRCGSGENRSGELQVCSHCVRHMARDAQNASHLTNLRRYAGRGEVWAL